MRSFNLNKITSLGLRIALIMVVMAGCVYGGRVEYNDDVLSGIKYAVVMKGGRTRLLYIFSWLTIRRVVRLNIGTLTRTELSYG